MGGAGVNTWRCRRGLGEGRVAQPSLAWTSDVRTLHCLFNREQISKRSSNYVGELRGADEPRGQVEEQDDEITPQICLLLSNFKAPSSSSFTV